MVSIRLGARSAVVLLLAGHVTGCATTSPAPELRISIGITERPTNADICIRGTNFSPNRQVHISYSKIPAPEPKRDGPTGPTSAAGTFEFRDTTMDFGKLIQCSPEQIQQSVQVSARDDATGNMAFAYAPGGYWCTNAIAVGTDFNGGCH